MQRIDGTAARQLDLIDSDEIAQVRKPRRPAPSPMKLLRQDIYAELVRRRRRAQIAARRWTNEQ